MVWGLSPELAILFGTASAGLLGFIVGGLAIRRQGIYFAMVTLALAQMVYFVALQMPFTGGENGLQAIPRGRLFGVIDLDDTMTMRSEEHTSELQSLMRISYAVFCLKQKNRPISEQIDHYERT